MIFHVGTGQTKSEHFRISRAQNGHSIHEIYTRKKYLKTDTKLTHLNRIK